VVDFCHLNIKHITKFEFNHGSKESFLVMSSNKILISINNLT